MVSESCSIFLQTWLSIKSFQPLMFISYKNIIDIIAWSIVCFAICLFVGGIFRPCLPEVRGVHLQMLLGLDPLAYAHVLLCQYDYLSLMHIMERKPLVSIIVSLYLLMYEKISFNIKVLRRSHSWNIEANVFRYPEALYIILVRTIQSHLTTKDN